MKVLMLLSNPFRPDPRVEKEATALVEMGHEVTVLCWDRGWDHPPEELHKGVRVIRVRTRKFESKASLATNFFSFMARCLQKARGMDFDAVHSHDLDTLPIGIMISRLNGTPLVYDAHEHYAKMIEQDVPRTAAMLIDRLERCMVPRVDRVIAANDMIAAYLSSWTGAPPTVVMNCIDVQPDDGPKRDRQGDVVLFYGGSLEPLRYIEGLLDQVKGVTGLKLRLAGSGSLKGIVEAAARDDPNVQYLGHLDKESLSREMSSADGVLALLDPSNENNRIGTPNRMYEAMAHGTPVIASEGTLSGDIVRAEDCGIVIKWGEGSLRDIVESLRDRDAVRRWGENGRKAVAMRYNWNIMKGRLGDLYSSLT